LFRQCGELFVVDADLFLALGDTEGSAGVVRGLSGVGSIGCDIDEARYFGIVANLRDDGAAPGVADQDHWTVL
jgi:hypothetical protein